MEKKTFIKKVNSKIWEENTKIFGGPRAIIFTSVYAITIGFARGVILGRNSEMNYFLEWIVDAVLTGVLFFIFLNFINLLRAPYLVGKDQEKRINELEEIWEGNLIKAIIPVTIFKDNWFIDNYSSQKRVGIWIENPSRTKILTDLNIELIKLFWITGDNGNRIDKTDFVCGSNRHFTSGDTADISSPILPGRKRLIYIIEIQDNELILLLTKSESASKNYFIQTAQENLKLDSITYNEYLSTFLIELKINGNIDGRPIKDRYYKIVIYFRRRLTRWVLNQGFNKKEELPHSEICIEVGEVVDNEEIKDQIDKKANL